MDIMAMAAAERAELADFLDGLTAEQWTTPSLCAGWTVHDVVAHMISYEEHGGADLLRSLKAARFRFSRLNDVAMADYRTLDPQALVAFLRAHLTPRGSTAKMGGMVGLVDGMIHQQDIRRPLDAPRVVPVERLLPALKFAVTAPPLRGFWHGRGVRLVATDVDWSRGRGREARGSGETILMTLAGRAGVAHELTGPGAAALTARLG